MTDNNTNIRVVVIDDSPTARELIVGILSNYKGIHVVGTGSNGEDAIRLVNRLRPDVVTMDIRMPVMDGLEATRHIMRDTPTPIVIISGSMQHQDMDMTFKAMRVGALAALSKPGLDDPTNCDKVAQTVRLMAGVKVLRHWHRDEPVEAQKTPEKAKEVANQDVGLPFKTQGGRKTDLSVVAIASSTGGPSALANILGGLPANYPLPILVVQHVSAGFATGLAEWLATQTKMRVEVPAHGDSIRSGVVYLAPDDYHMRVTASGFVEMSKAPPYKGLRPSANHLFDSVAQVYGSRALGIIMTGMGDDGADGMLSMYRAGALTVAQNAESCVVYGMPKEAVARSAVDRVLALEQIALLLEELGRHTLARLNNSRIGERGT